jgi:hypothetical protein
MKNFLRLIVGVMLLTEGAMHLKIAEASPGDCGYGSFTSIEDRVSDCNRSVVTSDGFKWSLVARFASWKHVWRDDQTGLLWGDLIDHRFSHYEAISLDETQCVVNPAKNEQTCRVVTEAACDSSYGLVVNGQIGERKFGLPTREEFQEAFRHGAFNVLPHMFRNNFYWTSTISTRSEIAIQIWTNNGNDFREARYYGKGDNVGESFPTRVRCVGR